MGRRDADAAFEGPGEMALVAKARSQGYLDNRRVGCGQLVAGVFDSQLTNVISDRALVRLVKGLSQVDRMHADVVGHFGQREALCEARMQKVSGLLQPPRRQTGGNSR